MGSPRVDVVFRLWQCDKENHGWREGPPVTVLCQSFRSAGWAFTLRQRQFQRKKNTPLRCWLRALTQHIGRFKTTIRPSGSVDATALGTGNTVRCEAQLGESQNDN